MSETKKVLVVVGPRGNGAKGWFAAGRFWPEGETEAELTEEDIEKLKGRTGLVIVDAAKIQAVIPDEKKEQEKAAKAAAEAAEAAARSKALPNPKEEKKR